MTKITLNWEKKQEVKLVVEETVQIAEWKREVKGKGERERYIHLNAELKRIARRDKKAFLNEQHKEIEENNRMAKTRDLFNEIGDLKGTFHTRMNTLKDKNSKYLREAGKIKKWQ